MGMVRASDRPAERSAWHLFETALGVVGIAWSDRGIVRLQLPEADPAATEARLGSRAGGRPTEPPPRIAAVVADLRRYAAGERTEFDQAGLDLRAVPPFHRAVYDAARALRFGEIATYAEIAEDAGAPGAARAVGHAMARNPVPILIPCHRVLAAGGRPGGFSAHGGRATKIRLLALEGISLDGGQLWLPGID